MNKAIFGSFLLFTFALATAWGATAEDLLEQIRAGRAALEVIKKKPMDFKGREAIKASMTEFFEGTAKWEREERRLTSLIYQNILANSPDEESYTILATGYYKNIQLLSFDESLLVLDVHETWRLIRGILTKGQMTRYKFGFFDYKTLRELGRRFVLAGYTVSRFTRLFDHLHIYAQQTEDNPAFARNHNEAIESLIEGMLLAAKQNPDLEKKIIAGIVANFDRATLKTKFSLLINLSKAVDASAYAFIKKQFQSEIPEVKKAAYLSLSRVRTIEATDDMIRWVKGIEAGTIKPWDDSALKGNVVEIFHNKVMSDLERTSNHGIVPNAADYLAVEKMRKLVFESLQSPNPAIKSNLQTMLRTGAFTQSEIDAHLMPIATDPNPKNHWSATYIVQWRNLTSATAEKAMQLLLDHPDEDTRRRAASNLTMMPKWRLTAPFCRNVF